MKIYDRLVDLAISYFRVRKIVIICPGRVEFDQSRKRQLGGFEVMCRESLNSRLQISRSLPVFALGCKDEECYQQTHYITSHIEGKPVLLFPRRPLRQGKSNIRSMHRLGGRPFIRSRTDYNIFASSLFIHSRNPV